MISPQGKTKAGLSLSAGSALPLCSRQLTAHHQAELHSAYSVEVPSPCPHPAESHLSLQSSIQLAGLAPPFSSLIPLPPSCQPRARCTRAETALKGSASTGGHTAQKLNTARWGSDTPHCGHTAHTDGGLPERFAYPQSKPSIFKANNPGLGF